MSASLVYATRAQETGAELPLERMLLDARARTLTHALRLTGEQLLGPRLSIINPPLWEIGHLGWFQERWCLRHRDEAGLRPSILRGADSLYDSSHVPHATRWDLPLPSFDETLMYLEQVLERVRERISRSPDDSQLEYFVQLAACHEEMHCEAFEYTCQTVAMAAPITGVETVCAENASSAGDVQIPGGEFMLGAAPGTAFVFDNEKWAHPVRVEPFRIARTTVSNGEFAAFVDDSGYRRRELWSAEGWSWRSSTHAECPVYWIKQAGEWYERRLNRIVPLATTLPVIHVNYFEAEAYCHWAGRRLPSETEWEFAASVAPREQKRRYPWGDAAPDAQRANLYGRTYGRIAVDALPEGDSAWGCRQMIGNVWEWTADAFLPYPGFVADPYKDYSEPWFGTHKVLRGGCYATRATFIRNTWRNFYTPDRRDVLGGFRTCAR